MTIEVASAISTAYLPNGSTKAFPFNFGVNGADQIAVIDGDAVELSSSLYTVSLDSDGEGGTVTFTTAPIAADYPAIYIVSDPDYKQLADFSNTGPSYDPEELTKAIDEAAVRDLHLRWLLGRALKVAPGVTPPEIGTIAEGDYLKLVNGKLVGFDLDADFSEVNALSDLLIAMAGGTEADDFADGVANTPSGEAFFFFESQQVKYYRNTSGVSEDAPLFVGGTLAVAADPPAFTTDPSISGTTNVGAILTGDDGEITGGTVSSRQWRRDGASIPNADQQTYQQTSEDVDADITYHVVATGDGGTAEATSAAVGPVTFLANQQVFGSAQMIDENNDPAGASEASHFYSAESAGSSGLANTTAPMMATDGSLAIAWDRPRKFYEFINRTPMLVGTQTNPTNRAMALKFVGEGQVANSGPAYWTFEINGSSSTASSWECESNRSIPATVARVVPHAFVTGGNLQLDILDLDTGTWYRGTPVAAPADWAGAERFTYPVTVGAHRGSASYTFPADHNGTGLNAPQSNPGARGSFNDLLVSDTRLTDANIEAIYMDGDDAVTTVGSANVRMHCPLVTNGAIDLAVTSNIAGLSGTNMVQEGTINPGPHMKRQGAAYITLDNVPYPGALVRGNETWAATGKAAGVTGTAQYRYVNRDGNALTAWTDTSHTLVSGDLTVQIPPPPSSALTQLQLQVRFSDQPTLIGATHSDMQGVAHIVLWSQSEGVLATTGNANNTGTPNGLEVETVGNTRTITWVNTLGQPRATEGKHGILGDGAVTISNAIREVTEIPVVFAQHQISGTSKRDLMDDSVTGRQWADEQAAHEFVLNRTSSGAVPITAHIDIGWDASDNVIAYGREVLAPWLTGSVWPGSTFAFNIDHHLDDGTFADGTYYQMPCNRATQGNASTSLTTDQSSEADQRDSQRNWGAAALLNYEIGPETTSHSIENESGGVLPSGATTHPGNDTEGQIEMAAMLAETALLAMGLGTYPGAVFYESIRPGTAANQVIVQIGSPHRYPGENLADPDTGYDVTNFTVPTNLVLSTKAVGGNAKWSFEAKIDNAGAWDIANVTSATFISDTECELTLSSNYVAGETQIVHHPGTTGSYRDATVNQQDWRDGLHFFTISGKKFQVAGSNQPLTLPA